MATNSHKFIDYLLPWRKDWDEALIIQLKIATLPSFFSTFAE